MSGHTRESVTFGRRSLRTVAILLSMLAFAVGVAAETTTPAKASAVTIGPAFSGLWYDPAQSGHGIFVEVLPENRFLAWWFAFNPEGTQQTWFGGIGTYVGDTATIPDVQIATGGKWIPNFDPSKIVRASWGTLTFKFSDCNTGRVDFASTYPGYGSNHMDLSRLTMPAGLMCPPPSSGAPNAAQGIWTGMTSAGENSVAIVLDDGTYYVLYSRPGNSTDAGVVQGTETAVGGTLSSSDAIDFPIALATETSEFATPASLNGNYAPRSDLHLTFTTSRLGARTLTATYVAGSDQPPNVTAAAGQYSGISGHVYGRRVTSFIVDASGNITGGNDAGCRFTGTITPRASIHAFDWTLRATNNGCIFGSGPIFGVMYYDDATRQIHGFAPYSLREDHYYLIATKQ